MSFLLKISLPVMALSVAVSAVAQDYALEILPDKKVIHIDKLGMAETTTLAEMLSMMPELLNRNAEDILAYYDIQYDGKSTREGRYVVLSQTRLGELEKIEITSSPTVAQQKNGQGGVINIIPRHIDEGFTGNASLDASTEWDVMPGADFNYRKGKLELRSSVNLEYNNPLLSYPSKSYSSKETVYTLDTLRRKYLQETAKVSLKYTFSEHDKVQVWLIESWMRQNDDRNSVRIVNTDMSEEMGEGWKKESTFDSRELQENRQFSFVALGKYEHKFDKPSKLTVSTGYEFNKEHENRSSTGYSSTLFRPHSLNLGLEYENVIVSDKDRELKLETGADAEYRHNYSETQEGANIYLSPYANLKYKEGNWTLHAGARYQCYLREFGAIDKDTFRKPDHDVTANVNAVWQVAPHHALRLVLLRNIIRPSDEMLYPTPMFDFAQNMWRKGNPSLKTEYIHSVDANYVFDWSSDEGRYLVFNAGLGYDRADGVVEKHFIVQDGSSSGKGMGRTLDYFTYENTGSGNIIKGSLSLFYSKGIFSVGFSGNVFGNFSNNSGKAGRYSYFNVSCTPIFYFRKQWTLSGKVMYNGPVNNGDTYLGDCFLMQIRLSKSIRRWTLNAVISDVFDYVSEDISVSGDHTHVSVYDLYNRFISLGFTYHFGK